MIRQLRAACFGWIICCISSFVWSDPVLGAENDEECVLRANLWTGSAQETAAIVNEPIPNSFRSQFESTAPCNPLVVTSLLGWHMLYGTAESALAALDYLQKPGSIFRRPRAAAELTRDLKQHTAAFRRAMKQKDSNQTEQSALAIADVMSGAMEWAWSADGRLTFAELFDAPKWLDLADMAAQEIDQIVGRFDRAVEGLPPEPLKEALVARRNAGLALSRLKARSALLRHRLGADPAALADARLNIIAAFDPAYEIYLEAANSGRIADCDGLLDGNFRGDTDIVAACDRTENQESVGLALETLEFYGLVYRAALLMGARPDAFAVSAGDIVPFRPRIAVISDDGAPRTAITAINDAKNDFSFVAVAAHAATEIHNPEFWTSHSLSALLRFSDEALAASWAAAAAMTSPLSVEDIASVEAAVWRLKEALSGLHRAMAKLPSGDWPSLWRRLATDYVLLDARYSSELKKLGWEKGAYEVLRLRQIEAQIASLAPQSGR